MSTIIFFVSTIILAVVLMSKIPGLEHFVKPIIDLLFTFIKFLAANVAAWGVFVLKGFINSHTDLLRHLVSPPEAIDPSLALKDDK